MRDDPALHLDTKSSKGTSLLLLFCISVTVGSSPIRITHILKWMWILFWIWPQPPMLLDVSVSPKKNAKKDTTLNLN
jgi:hypothetical protein